MEFGAHLPLMDFGGHPYTLDHLIAYTTAVAQLGFTALSVNDHMVFSVPWLDGPTALVAVMEHSAEMTLATTVALVVVPGPVPVAKTLAAIDRLSGGRLLAAVGPGSSPEDFTAVGLDCSERVATLRRGDRRAAGVVARRRCAVRRPFLLDRGCFIGTPSRPPERTTGLGGQLGL